MPTLVSATKNYTTDADFRAYLKDDTTLNADLITAVIGAASRAVDSFCGRYFYQQIEDQFYFPDGWWVVDLGDMDIATTSGLVVKLDSAADNSYATTLTLNVDYFMEPVNQSSNGINPWPYEFIRIVGSNKFFPIHFTPWQYPTVKVTATYGWPTAPPDAVVHATKIIAAQMLSLAGAPSGVIGFNGWGEVRVKDVPMASMLLQPYRKGGGIGIA